MAALTAEDPMAEGLEAVEGPVAAPTAEGPVAEGLVAVEGPVATPGVKVLCLWRGPSLTLLLRAQWISKWRKYGNKFGSSHHFQKLRHELGPDRYKKLKF